MSSGAALIRPPDGLEWATPTFLELLGLGTTIEGSDFPARIGTDLRPLGEAIERVSTHRAPATVTLHLSPKARADDAGREVIVIATWVPGTGTDPRVHLLVQPTGEGPPAMQQARLFYESFLTSNNAIEVTDKDGVLVDVNPAFERIYGYSRDECIGRKPNLVRSRQTPRALYEEMWKALLDPAVGHWSGEILNRERHGQERPVFLTITAVRSDAGETTHYVGVAVDLTTQRRWERGAARADRLAAVGQLAAGVAHEINTPLANILLVAEGTKERTEDAWVASRLDTISRQVEIASRIVRGLLDFSRQTETRMVPLDLREVARDTVEFLQGKQRADVEIEQHYPTEPVPILGDRGQLMQVVTNVLNNAYDAIDGAGRILIRVRSEGTEAELEISDSGTGIPAEVLPRLFEPFYTTKEQGKGTGLGLAICHGIMQAHRGSIVAQNLLGGGASFLLRIPVRFAPPDPAGRDLPPSPRGVPDEARPPRRSPESD